MMKKNGESVTATALCPSAHLLSLCRATPRPTSKHPGLARNSNANQASPFPWFYDFIKGEIPTVQYPPY